MDKNLLILGASGMVGQNLKDGLNKFKLKYISPSSNELNLRKYSLVKNFFKNNNITHVINCAGLVGGIKKNLNNNLDFFQINLEINYNLFNAAYDAGIKNIINLGSSCMYPKKYKRKMSEKDLATGDVEETNYGYALAKNTTSNYLKLLRDSKNLNYVTLIPCNLYGYYDNFEIDSSHLIPGLISKFYFAKKNNKKEITIWGSGEARREFLFTSDLTNFIIKKYMENTSFKDPFLNIGYGKDYKIIDFYKKIQKILKTNFKFTFDLKQPEGVQRKLIDSSLAIEKYKWSPSVKLEEGIKKTIKFHEKQKI